MERNSAHFFPGEAGNIKRPLRVIAPENQEPYGKELNCYKLISTKKTGRPILDTAGFFEKGDLFILYL